MAKQNYQRTRTLLIFLILLGFKLNAHERGDVAMNQSETGSFAALRTKARAHLEKIEKLPKIHAPEFPASFQWLHTERPITLKSLRGHIVLLDFWTYGCINCMHIIPDLNYLEEKYREAPFRVIGVHSAKFTNEQDAEHVRQAAERLGITHPVVVDENFQIWSSYGVRAWPTLVLIGPDGNILATLSGEGHRDLLDALIGESLTYFGQRGRLARRQAPIVTPNPEPHQERPFLKFPGKLVADEEHSILYLSDTGNHRILILSPEGRVLDQIGSGRAGWRDGTYQEARLNHPQGLVLWKGSLWIADTDNHLIRRVDLQKRMVETAAGTGKRAFQFRGNADPKSISLNSPWDLAVSVDVIFIAMAGTHQIWAFEPDRKHLYVYAGTGMEAREDGTRWTATFAQPSGLTTDGTTLYIADSESSSLRAIHLPTGNVTTLAGGDLFDFGDRDGPGAAARFQHPLGIFSRGTRLYIADTYNHKIKVLDLTTNQVTTLYGDGRSGFRDGTDPRFFEPSDVIWFRKKIYVVDSGNHAIRRIDPKRGVTSTLKLQPAPSTDIPQKPLQTEEPEVIVRHPPARITTTAPVTLQIQFNLSSGLKRTKGPPLELEILYRTGRKPPGTLVKETVSDLNSGTLRFSLPQGMIQNPGELELLLKYVVCEEATGLCRMQISHHRIPVTIDPNGARLLSIQEIPGPK